MDRSSDPLSLIGQLFGQFRVGRVLPGSRSGLIYTGWDIAAQGASGQQSAVWLRFFDPEYAKHTDAVRAQAETWSRFSHERYLPIAGCELTSPRGPFLGVAPCDGTLLCEHLDGKRLEVTDAVKLALSLGDVLVQAHIEGLVHLGISDEAVVVPRGGDVGGARLFGLGIVSAFERTEQPPWHYLAPEQLTEPACDQRADVYALGVLLYRCLTGEYPVALPSTQTADQLWRQMLSGKRRELGPMLERWFEGLAQVVERAIERDREKRFQTSAELVAALRACGIAPSEIATEKSEPKGHVVAPHSTPPPVRATPADRTLSPTAAPAPGKTEAGKARPKTLRLEDEDAKAAPALGGDAAPGADPLIGVEVKDVRIERALASGGMGAVYLAKHTSLGRTWVVKVADIDAAPNAERWFKQEALITAALREKGERRVPEVLGHGKLPDGRPYMVMEFVRGRSLSDVLKETPKLAIPRALKLTARVCDTLERAHNFGFVHRDIKPTNIMVVEVHGKEGSDVYILDWGVAKGAGEAKQVSTFVGMIVGTPGYMPPEATLGELVDGRGDVFSVACVLYEMLAGRTAFTGATAQLLMGATRSDEPPRLSTLRSDAQEELCEIVHGGLTKNVDNRPTMAQFRAQLEAFMRDWSARQASGIPNLHSTMLSTSAPADDVPLSGRPTQAAVDPDRKDFRMRVVAPDPTRPNRTSPPLRPKRGLFVAMGAAAALLLGAGGWLLLRPSASVEPPVASEPAASSPPAPAPPTPKQDEPPAIPAKPAAVRVGHARIVTTPPGATVLVDGEVIGETPLDLSGRANDVKRVQVKLDGYEGFTKDVMLNDEVADVKLKRLRAAHRKERPSRSGQPEKKPANPNALPTFGEE